MLVRFTLLLVSLTAPLLGETLQLRDGSRLEVDSYTVEGSSVFLTTKQDIRIVDFADVIWPSASKANAAAAPVRATPSTTKVHRLLDEAAERHGLPAPLLHAVAAVESNYQQNARSGPGAIGVMQLMPATARQLGADPHDTAQNIDAGTRFLRELLIKYGNDLTLALAAYNAGPGAVDFYGGVPPYRETQHYVRKTISLYRANRRQ
jgi:soluble lytic murein transglycosylase-like protein